MPDASPKPEPSRVPVRWNWLFNGFCRYVRRYLRKNFNAVRLSLSSANIPNDGLPIIVVLNHPSWWDPLLCTVVSTLFHNVTHYGAIDAEALKKYPLFTKLGFFGVDTSSLRGAAEFLKVAEEIFATPNRSIWVTAQGQFTDVRVRPLALKSGVGHLAARLEQGWILPVAYEYTFWNEKLPEAMIRVGEPIRIADHPGIKGKQWTDLIEAHLTTTLDVLNQEVQSRDPSKFRIMIDGQSGIGGPYDWFRRSFAWLRGKRFESRHETKVPN
jgi:1-acyl-sn-glycerol-3-phosphate acyltransferase